MKIQEISTHGIFSSKTEAVDKAKELNFNEEDMNVEYRVKEENGQFVIALLAGFTDKQILSFNNKIHYSTDGKGNWHKTEFKPQCSVLMFLETRQCQGTENHKGVHWCYFPHGSFYYEDTENGCSGSIPPEHKDYVDPTKMIKQCYFKFHEKSEIFDKELIARLENNDLKD